MEYIIQNIDSRGVGILKIKWVFAIAESTGAQSNQPVQLIITAVLFVALYLTVCQQFCEKTYFPGIFISAIKGCSNVKLKYIQRCGRTELPHPSTQVAFRRFDAGSPRTARILPFMPVGVELRWKGLLVINCSQQELCFWP